ncbi:phage tail protein [Fusobacterium polymorphum]|uniref:phage tail protein n=1 Tax=Fusobacterium nucleatum subsp. polymorphum TaxID=76857 RepID=UPI0021C26383|nr:phage tail protein [Fusobacterium polymorphum]
MSYFEGLKLTKKGEQLQAKINGNLSETLTFTKAKLGSGSITSNDEIRFLTDVKEVWGTANVTSCKIQGDEKNIVAIELQFSNAELREDKIFREIGLYAQGNEGEEILYAYANAGDKYDYIPLMKDSPHSFIIVIYFNITSGSKVDAKIDLHSYVSLQEFNEGMNKKVNKTDYASAEQYGIVKYGTQESTALEGNKFTQMMGKDYGGILNEPGTKEVGKAYWDNNTKKLYICKNNNSDISPNINNYIPFDNGSILERLENLIKTDTYGAQNSGYFELFNRIIVYGSFNYIFGTSSIQNFEIRESIRNWENANVICSWREINLNLTNTTVSALMTSPTTLSIKSNIVSSGRGTVSYLIIARI